MNHLYKGKAKYILTWALALLFAAITLYGSNYGFTPHYFHSNLTPAIVSVNEKITNNIIVDTPPVKKVLADSVLLKDSMVVVTDTINFKTSKDSLDAPVNYHADDSMVLDVPSGKITLYGKENKVKYIDNELTAPQIEFDQKTSLVSAYLVKDSTGEVIAFPKTTSALSLMDGCPSEVVDEQLKNLGIALRAVEK